MIMMISVAAGNYDGDRGGVEVGIGDIEGCVLRWKLGGDSGYCECRNSGKSGYKLWWTFWCGGGSSVCGEGV